MLTSLVTVTVKVLFLGLEMENLNVGKGTEKVR